ncbi:glycosyltransferase [Agarivorans sp. Alg241-V36]|uniref:glycosyltransferase n=1 Tax=Agarivorans sp. Alg241-V36 TaxID=2305992 RepID=UPI0013D79450|nr:glycosyltransferase [Agarivorans sp. Alg241-V36]
MSNLTNNNGLPLITVYITSFNRPEMLSRAIESVINQSYVNWELIIIDDASDNDVASVIIKYSHLDSRIKYWINEKQSGANFNRNLAIEKAQGKYITGLDDDDYFKPNRLEFFMGNYNSKYAFICDNRDVLESDGTISQSYKSKEQEVSLSDILKSNVCGNQIFAETQRLRKLGGFDLNIRKFQDHDMWISLISNFGSAYRFNECSYVVDVRHEQQRISNIEDTNQANVVLYYKYKNLYTPYTDSSIRLKIASANLDTDLPFKVTDFIFHPIESLKLATRKTLKKHKAE